MISQFRHAGLVVADLDRAVSFWTDLLGFTVQRRMEEGGPYLEQLLGLQGARVTTVKLSAPDGVLIELLRFHSHPDAPAWQGHLTSTGLTHLAFTVRDLDAVCARLTAAGYPAGVPHTSPDGKVRVIFVQGPERLWLELVERLDA